MIEKPSSITLVGVVQLLLAGSFVVWLLFFPATGQEFAWPTTPAATAMFIGAGFIGRAFIGYDLMRQRYWTRLRWQILANYAFLAFVWLATLWHVDEMNWVSNIWVAHVWVLAYTVEPVLLFLWEPRGAGDALPAALREGPVLPGLKRVVMVGLVVTITLAGLMMINPAFMDLRWPWPLDPFNCRVMSAFLALNAGWCYTIYVAEDWAEIKKAVIAVDLFLIAEFGVWLTLVRSFDPQRTNRYVFGMVLGIFAIVVTYYLVRQEQLRARPAASRNVA